MAWWTPPLAHRRARPKVRQFQEVLVGETRTRTGDTTISRDSGEGPSVDERPANQKVPSAPRPARCRRLCLVWRGFGTPRQPQSPIDFDRSPTEHEGEGRPLLALNGCREQGGDRSRGGRRRANTRCQPGTNRSGTATAGQTGPSPASGSVPAPEERTLDMLSSTVLAIAGTGYGLIGLLVIIVLVLLIIRLV